MQSFVYFHAREGRFPSRKRKKKKEKKKIAKYKKVLARTACPDPNHSIYAIIEQLVETFLDFGRLA